MFYEMTVKSTGTEKTFNFCCPFYSTGAIKVFVNGVQKKKGYSQSGKTVVFESAPRKGTITLLWEG